MGAAVETTLWPSWFPRRLPIFNKRIRSYPQVPFHVAIDPNLLKVDWFLNILGTSPPISIESHQPHETRQFRVNFKSSWTIAALLSGLISIFFWINYGLQTACDFAFFGSRHSGLLSDMQDALESNHKMDEKVVATVLFVVKAIFVIVTVGEILETICGWCTFPLFIRFLNGWADFEYLYGPSAQKPAAAVPATSGLSTQEYSGKIQSRLIVIGLMVYVGGPTVPGILYHIMKEARAGNSAIAIIKYSYFVLRFVTVGLLMDAKQLFVYHSISRSFYQINQIIEETLARGTVSASVVYNWRKAIEMVRRQCELACRYQQPSQLLFICRCTAQLTLFAFVILNTPREDTFSQMFSFFWLAYCTLQIIRLSVKMYMAQRVPSSERLIASCLSAVRSGDVDQATFNEVKFTFDLINQRPAEIVYGGFIKMETRLLAGILGQAVTYLIVMMQYVQSLT